jgi:hypothetical protein
MNHIFQFLVNWMVFGNTFFADLNTRAISRFSTDTTLPRDVSEDMILREPNANRLFVLTGANKRKKPSDVPKFEWFEDQEVTFWGQVTNGTTNYTSVATNILVADVTIFAVGDTVAVPQAASSSAAEEVILVTAVTGATSGTLTVTRNVGSAGADTIGATVALRIIGSALTEDSDTPTQRYQAQTVKVSYCQIFRTPVQITHTAASSKKYGGPDRKYQLMKALIRHRSEIEAAGLWSRASESLSGSSSRWTSMGLKPIIATNKTTNVGTLTQTSFNTFSETAFRFGEDQKLFMCAPRILSAINNFSLGKINTYVDDKVFGLSLQRYIAPLGEYLLHNNFRLEAGITGGLGFDDEAYSVDLPSVGLRYLDGGESLIGDTKLYNDVQQDGTTVRVDEYRSQMGWEFRHEVKHALMSGVLGYS